MVSLSSLRSAGPPFAGWCHYWWRMLLLLWLRTGPIPNCTRVRREERGIISFVEAFSSATSQIRTIRYTSSTSRSPATPPTTTGLSWCVNRIVNTPLFSQPNTQTIYNENEKEEDEDDDDDHSCITARSCFGTKSYWDDVYAGRGDFPREEYSWYYDWNVIQKYMVATLGPSFLDRNANILIPGIGNDPILYTLIKAGYQHLTAQDYSAAAIDRQRDLLSDITSDTTTIVDLDQNDSNTNNTIGTHGPIVQLSCCNVLKPLPYRNESFDVILEKGLFDAIYLSNDIDDNEQDNTGGVLSCAVQHLTQTLKPGGILVSVSGVVPPAIRNKVFAALNYECLRDGTNDLKAGCFIFQKQTLSR